MACMPKRVLFLTILLFFIGASAAPLMATETRVGSMGGVGMYTRDNSNIFYFPGTLYAYKNQVVGELRVQALDNSYSVGVHYPARKQCVIGAYLNRPIRLAPALDEFGIENVTLDQSTDLLYGRQMANFDFGFRLSFGFDSYDDGDTGILKEEESARYIGLAAGISNSVMDLGVQFEMPSAKWEQDTFSIKWGGTALGANGRLFYGGETQIVPVGTFYMASGSVKFTPDPDPTAKVDYSAMNVGVGIGFNRKINEDNLLVMAIELFGMSSYKIEPKDTTNYIDYYNQSILTMPGLYMGVESKIKPWLTGRIGAAQTYQKYTNKTRNYAPEIITETLYESSATVSNFNVSFGLGFHFGDFDIDAAINEGFFFDGPYFLSGENNSMANRLSVTYNF